MSTQVEFRNVSKTFPKLTLGGHTTLKDLLTRGVKAFDGQVKERRFTALSDVSLAVEQGRVLGIVGPNGAGKSTLLKLVAGIYHPTSGHIRVNGRVSALLSLGIGFHPDLTGRENVYISGLALGLSRKRIRDLLGEITRFAELEDFIDAPVRTYSSGMFMRLAFSVAVNVDPDILLLDEVLSVGDSSFSAKSKARIEEFKTAGKTILFVSHDLKAVEGWCHDVLWLERGCVVQIGEAGEVVEAYRRQHGGS
ncbi:MAG: ABC transporter ATP-binding protein [Thermotogota bacterium]